MDTMKNEHKIYRAYLKSDVKKSKKEVALSLRGKKCQMSLEVIITCPTCGASISAFGAHSTDGDWYCCWKCDTSISVPDNCFKVTLPKQINSNFLSLERSQKLLQANKS